MARARCMVILEGLPEAERNSFTVATQEITLKQAQNFAQLIHTYARALAQTPRRDLAPGSPWWTKGR